MRHVFTAVSLMTVMACIAPSEAEQSTDSAMMVAPIAVDLILAGDPDDGGESVVRQQGLVSYQASPPGAHATSTLPPDLSAQVPIPPGTVMTREYLASRLGGVAEQLRGFGFAVDSVCIRGGVCADMRLIEVPPSNPPGDGIGPKVQIGPPSPRAPCNNCADRTPECNRLCGRPL